MLKQVLGTVQKLSARIIDSVEGGPSDIIAPEIRTGARKMVKWEYLSFGWEYEGSNLTGTGSKKIFMDVEPDVRQRVVEHLNAALPELKARVNKKHRIEFDDMVYTSNALMSALMNALGEAGWELAGFGYSVYVFKRPRTELPAGTHRDEEGG